MSRAPKRIGPTDHYFFMTTNLARAIPSLTSAERVRKQFYLFAYVVMPTHLHILFEPGKAGLSANMRDFKSKTGIALANKRHHQGPVVRAETLR